LTLNLPRTFWVGYAWDKVNKFFKGKNLRLQDSIDCYHSRESPFTNTNPNQGVQGSPGTALGGQGT